MDARYRAAGKNPLNKRKTIFCFGAVLREGEPFDSPRVKAEAGPVAMMMLHNAMEMQEYGNLQGEFGASVEPDAAFGQLLREYRTLYEFLHTCGCPLPDAAQRAFDVPPRR